MAGEAFSALGEVFSPNNMLHMFSAVNQLSAQQDQARLRKLQIAAAERSEADAPAAQAATDIQRKANKLALGRAQDLLEVENQRKEKWANTMAQVDATYTNHPLYKGFKNDSDVLVFGDKAHTNALSLQNKMGEVVEIEGAMQGLIDRVRANDPEMATLLSSQISDKLKQRDLDGAWTALDGLRKMATSDGELGLEALREERKAQISSDRLKMSQNQIEQNSIDNRGTVSSVIQSIRSEADPIARQKLISNLAPDVYAMMPETFLVDARNKADIASALDLKGRKEAADLGATRYSLAVDERLSGLKGVGGGKRLTGLRQLKQELMSYVAETRPYLSKSESISSLKSALGKVDELITSTEKDVLDFEFNMDIAKPFIADIVGEFDSDEVVGEEEFLERIAEKNTSMSDKEKRAAWEVYRLQSREIIQDHNAGVLAEEHNSEVFRNMVDTMGLQELNQAGLTSRNLAPSNIRDVLLMRDSAPLVPSLKDVTGNSGEAVLISGDLVGQENPLIGFAGGTFDNQTLEVFSRGPDNRLVAYEIPVVIDEQTGMKRMGEPVPMERPGDIFQRQLVSSAFKNNPTRTAAKNIRAMAKNLREDVAPQSLMASADEFIRGLAQSVGLPVAGRLEGERRAGDEFDKNIVGKFPYGQTPDDMFRVDNVVRRLEDKAKILESQDITFGTDVEQREQARLDAMVATEMYLKTVTDLYMGR